MSSTRCSSSAVLWQWRPNCTCTAVTTRFESPHPLDWSRATNNDVELYPPQQHHQWRVKPKAALRRSASNNSLPLVRIRLLHRLDILLCPRRPQWRRQPPKLRYQKRWARYVPGLNGIDENQCWCCPRFVNGKADV